ncbi:MAG: hypothetical protein KDB65_11615 [Calditrichaeota bacterium]|nr:hypothetical protein [Calditrichota bacterium]MCB9368628.1 hypothetical protein [Calditrichota bacterium]
MKPAKLVQHLTEALEKQGYRFRNEKGNFRGGSCVFEAEKLVIMNKRFGDEERAEILAKALARMDIDSLYLLPEVREYVEQFADKPSIVVDLTAKAEESAAQ